MSEFRVLVHGHGPRLPITAETLHRRGAWVDYPYDQRTAETDDLKHRGVLHYVESPDVWTYDEVHRVHTPSRDVVANRHDNTHAAGPGELGRVTLVGGGPGDAGLLTLAGWEALQHADVIVCDRLAPLAVLDELTHQPEIIHVGKIPRGAASSQEAINDLLVTHALRGSHVVRFKGGDNFVFGRGGEEWEACARACVPVEVIPGVTSSVAVPALAGIPVTHRGATQGFIVVSGHVPPGDPRSRVNWDALVQSQLTLVILMGVAHLAAITAQLIQAGLRQETPAAVVEHGASPAQRVIRGTVANLARRAGQAQIGSPAVIVVGDVVEALPGSS